MSANDYVSVKEAAKITGFGYHAICRRARLGKIDGIRRCGREYEVPVSWTEKFRKGKSVTQIACELGISRQAYYKRLRRSGGIVPESA